MVRWAAQLNPDIEFRVGDIRSVELPAASLAGIVAFYLTRSVARANVKHMKAVGL